MMWNDSYTLAVKVPDRLTMDVKGDIVRVGDVFVTDVDGAISYILILSILISDLDIYDDFAAIGIHLYKHGQLDEHLGIPSFQGFAASTNTILIDRSNITKILTADRYLLSDCIRPGFHSDTIPVLDTTRMDSGKIALVYPKSPHCLFVKAMRVCKTKRPVS